MAEEREVVVDQPAQEGDALGDFTRRQRRRGALDVRDDGDRLVLHPSPVIHRRPDVREDAQEVGGERLALAGIGDPVDLDVDERFRVAGARVLGHEPDESARGIALDGNDRMDDEVLRQPVAVHLHRHRIDEERHVVVADLDDRMRRLPVVLLARRVEDPHLGVPRVALAGERPLRQRRTAEVRRRALGQIFRVDLPVVAVDEIRDLRVLRGRDLGRRERDDLRQDLDAAVRCDR